MRRARKILLVLLGLVLILGAGIYWLVATEAGLRFAWTQAQALSPVPLAGEVSGRLIGPLQVANLRVETKRARVDLAAADLDWQPLALLQGRLRFSRADLQELRVTVKPRDPGAPAGTPRIPTSPLLLDVNGRIQGLSVTWEEGREVRFERVALDAVAGPLRLKVRSLSLDGYGAHLDTEGEFGLRLDGEVQLTTRWRWQLPQGEELQGHGQIVGTLARPRAEQVFDAVLRGEAKGTLVWLDQPVQWSAEVSTRPVALRRLHRPWRALEIDGVVRGEGAAGRLQLEGRGGLNDPQLGAWKYHAQARRETEGWRVPLLVLSAVETQANLVASGVLHTSGDREVELDLRWTQLAFPYGAATPAVASPRGGLSVFGSLAGYRIHGRAQLARPGLPDGEIELEGSGDRNGMALTSLAATWLDGRLDGSGEVQWAPLLRWSADLQARDINPGQFRPDWPGRVAGRVVSRGERRADGLAAQMELTELTGELRGLPLTGHARFDLAGERLKIDELALQTGEARFTAAGTMNKHWDLRWEIDAERIQDLLPQYAGNVQAKGELQGPRDRPRLLLEGEGRELVWGQRRAGRLSFAADVDLSGAIPWSVRLEGEQVAVTERWLFERLALGGTGNAEDHLLALDASAEGRAFHVEATGSYRARQWQGRVTDGRLEDPALGVWTQAPAIAVTLTANSLRMEDWCWSNDGARACVALNGGPQQGWHGNARLEAFPVAALQPWMDPDFQLSGRLDGQGDFRLDNGLAALALELRAADGAFRFQVRDGEPIETGYRTLEITATADKRGLRAAGNLQLVSGDFARAEVTLPRWRPGMAVTAEQALRGTAEVSLGELVWLSVLVPDVIATGRLESRLSVAGTLANPLLEGNAALPGGRLAIPMLGIELADLQVAVQGESDRAMTLAGSARSGPGTVNVDGRMARDAEGWRLALRITGKNVEVVRLPQAEVLATPDLDIVIRGRDLRLTGSLLVPRARINLPEITGTVQSSPDVVIVDRPEVATRTRRWRVSSELSVRFGDDVRLQGYGLSGRLAGHIVVIEPAGGVAVGRGELEIVDGKYEAYGQDLTIEEGRLLYGNAPLDNPGIEFRAVREVQDVTVGILATGRLKKPQVQLYSKPAMDDTAVLAYLVLGRALETATEEEADLLQRAALSLGVAGGTEMARQIAGQVGVDVVNVQASAQTQEASLVLGKYLSPQLYVQYAVGFWEAGNAWQMRYRIDTNWTFKVESGLQSGADLLYTIEK